MSVYVALLRAIGPASHAVMRPAALRDRAEAAGFGDPVNYLATGNLIVTSRKGSDRVRRDITGLVEGFGLTGNEVFVATREEIAAIVAADPFPASSRSRPSRVGVCLFHAPLEWPAALLRPAGPEKVAPVERALIVDYGPGDAPSALRIEKLAGATMTQRNWNTILGIHARMRDR